MTSKQKIVLSRDDIYVLNHCTRYLARDNEDERHNFGQYEAGDPRGRIADAWRFPIIDSYSSGPNSAPELDYAFNEVTFVYKQPADRAQHVAVVGSFGELWDPIDLRTITGTPYSTVTVKVPKGQVHRYVFLVDGVPTVDPINPQRTVLDNGKTWSRFFTQLCAVPLVLDARERAVLGRLAENLLPFRIKGMNRESIQAILRSYYSDLDRRPSALMYLHVYHPDAAIGVVNFIDKLLAREESHHVTSYRVCLELIGAALERRHPGAPLESVPDESITALMEQMQRGSVPGWSFDRYETPAYFMQLLRRHVFTGAFSHPKYGGNAGAAGWAFLEDYFRDPSTKKTLFDWRNAVERPLGESVSYRGYFGRK